HVARARDAEKRHRFHWSGVSQRGAAELCPDANPTMPRSAIAKSADGCRYPGNRMECFPPRLRRVTSRRCISPLRSASVLAAVPLAARRTTGRRSDVDRKIWETGLAKRKAVLGEEYVEKTLAS